MATSGTTTFTSTRDLLIRDAALEVSAIGQGVTMPAEMVTDFARVLNAMVKHWQGRGLKIWTVKDATLFPVPGQTRYGAGSGATDHITDSYVKTTISANESSGQTVLSVTSTTGMTLGDYAGVILDDNTLHWSTIASMGSGNITLAAAITAAASAGNEVFTYTTKIPKPIRVVDARRYSISGDTETAIELISHQEYRHLPVRAQAGSMNLVQYDPQRVIGYFNIWAVPAATTELLKFTYHKPFEIFSTGADNPDFPEEWANCLKWNLAKELMGRYPVNPDRRRHILGMAESTLFDMEGFGREDDSIFIQPDFRR